MGMTANVDDDAAYPDPATLGGAPARGRELRAQGKRTMQRLLDAGLAVFAARGYHSTRVDDIVREARTSHGTFYLYFANKEDLLRALAGACVEDLEALAASVGRLGPGPDGEAALGAFRSIGGRDYARVDVMVRDSGAPIVLEVNTLPGMTETSLLPKAAAAAGISYAALCQRMIDLALRRR